MDEARDHVRVRLIRMLAEAKARRHDADILGQLLSTRSDSQAFLRVLAFEVLLKAAVISAGAIDCTSSGSRQTLTT